jgi:gluconolactonase
LPRESLLSFLSNDAVREVAMAQEAYDPEQSGMSRRTLLRSVGAAVGAAVLAPRLAGAQTPPMGPPSTITQPPRDFSPRGAPTTYFTDPDVLTVQPAFDGLRQPNAPIQRLWTGSLWAEGPAWNAQGRYLVWSDIPNNRQLRWTEDDGRVTVFRSPSNNSNGNTFDFQGRQISCEHVTRRVVRYEHDGSVTIIADSYEGKRLNSPNDIVPHPDGSYWFTDPPYGGQFYEGTVDAPGGPSNRAGRLKQRLGQPPEIGAMKRELPRASAALPSGRPRASSSAASACPRCAATSVSAGRSATVSSWPPASRSTPSTSTPRAPPPPEPSEHQRAIQ